LHLVEHPVCSSYVFDVFQDETDFFLHEVFSGIIAMPSMILLMARTIKYVNK
jgi:hypothetical protein